jgi:serine/threonine protein kinase
MSDAERQTLGDFALEAKLGESGPAEVFRARGRTDGVVVALKRWRRPFPPGLRRGYAETWRLHREISDHPSIIRLYGSEPAGDHPWLATELRERSLADLMADGPIAPARAWWIATDVLRGLIAIHDRERGHGDLTPANVLVSDGRAVLSDLAPATESPSTAIERDTAAAATLIGELFPDPPPALRAVLPRPPTVEAMLAALEGRRGAPKDQRADNAGSFRRGGNLNVRVRPAEPGDLPGNLRTPTPASRRENAGTYSGKPSAARRRDLVPVTPGTTRPGRLRLAALTAGALAAVATVTVVIAYMIPAETPPRPGRTPFSQGPTPSASPAPSSDR